MTMPREIYVCTDDFMTCNSRPQTDTAPYYSQAVLDEKDARIDGLEKLLREINGYLNKGHGTCIYNESIFHQQIRETLAGKGGSDETAKM